MTWIVGVDEAGYGPNLGPFVMSSVACRGPGDAAGDLWQLLSSAVCRASDGDDSRIAIDDSKAIYAPGKGLAALERSVLACLGTELIAPTLRDLLDLLCPDCAPALEAEGWYAGDSPLPAAIGLDDFAEPASLFRDCCEEFGVTWQVRSVVVCPARFNKLTEAADSKGAVLAEALGQLLRWNVANLDGDEPLVCWVDKHGGRNHYAASLQHGLPQSIVIARRESALLSTYALTGLSRPIELSFLPRADQSHLCVALASMISKYLRELLMGEFNRYWCGKFPGLRPTAGYPGDSSRFYQAIRPALLGLGLEEDAVWRRR